MPYPKQHEIEIPLLRALAELGGQAKPKQVDHGVFLTTARFTSEAEAASVKKVQFLSSSWMAKQSQKQ